MSVLDKATNDALNAVMDLHFEVRDSKTGAPVCYHCYDRGSNKHRSWPCPTTEVMLEAVEPIVAARSEAPDVAPVEATVEDIIASTPLGRLGK